MLEPPKGKPLATISCGHRKSKLAEHRSDPVVSWDPPNASLLGPILQMEQFEGPKFAAVCAWPHRGLNWVPVRLTSKFTHIATLREPQRVVPLSGKSPKPPGESVKHSDFISDGLEKVLETCSLKYPQGDSRYELLSKSDVLELCKIIKECIGKHQIAIKVCKA